MPKGQSPVEIFNLARLCPIICLTPFLKILAGNIKSSTIHFKFAILKEYMERLHAYWRCEYVEAPKNDKDNDIFIKLPQEKEDKKSLILCKSAYSYMVLNRYPYNAGHLLVVPFRSVTFLTQLSVEERNDLMEMMVKGEQLLQKTLKPDGFNVGFNLGKAAGAGIPAHLHGHIVPRWLGDTNFMPVLGQTRVLVQSLEDMWERLKASLQS